jgi:hypothetical protein
MNPPSGIYSWRISAIIIERIDSDGVAVLDFIPQIANVAP